MKTIFLDTREQLTPRVLDAWADLHPQKRAKIELIPQALEVGDWLAGNTLIEIKWGCDCHDYTRLEDELSRMYKLRSENPYFDLHLIVCDTSKYEITPREYEILVSFAQKYYVKIHHPKSLIAGMDKLYELTFYNREFIVPPQAKMKGLTFWENQLAQYKGCSSDKAKEIVEQMVIFDQPPRLDPACKDYFTIGCDVAFGLTKFNESKKITKDMLKQFFGGNENE